jgi:hypothetical protein
MAEALTCDMVRGCANPVTHIDNKGWVYCEKHGPIRRMHGTPCRKMTAAEVKRLESGQTIPYRR